MADSKTLSTLTINKVESPEVFEYLVSQGLINNDELYLVSNNSSEEEVIAAQVNINATNTDAKYYLVGTSGTGAQPLYRAYNASGSQNTAGVYFNGSTGVLYGAAWNDYAEFRETIYDIEPGRCVIETGFGDLLISHKRLQPGANIVSDTFGFAIGETNKCKTPLAVAGRVLAYPYEDKETYQAGDAVCSGPNGTISKMTREEIIQYPDRIVGTVSEIPYYKTWGENNVAVNGRIWIKIK